MQKNQTARKLVLNKETLRNLVASALPTIDQAVITSCGEPCCGDTTVNNTY